MLRMISIKNYFKTPISFKNLMLIVLWGFISQPTLANKTIGPSKEVQLKQQFQKKAEIKEIDLPNFVEIDGEKYQVDYTFNYKLSKYIRKLLKRYRSDYSSVVVVDNNTGKILTLVDYNKKAKKFGTSLSVSNTHPAASIFKIVSAAELLENSEIEKSSVFEFVGKSTTLYRYQLKERKSRRWLRYIAFEKAFAYSNNVVFGKAAVNNLTGIGLYKMAHKFGFNRSLNEKLSFAPSILRMPQSQYNLAEISSGLNRETMTSPLHVAMIASIVANDGKLYRPQLINKVVSDSNEEVFWEHNIVDSRVISESTAKDLQDMMELTVTKGTARRIFRRFMRKHEDKIRVGGKTGTITGGVPYGRRDWFTAYAQPIDKSEDKGISIAVMNVNVKKWYVKSTYLARKIIEYYYKHIKESKS